MNLPEHLHAPPEGRVARVNDLDLYYEEYGSGDPLLLVHGYFRTGGMWDRHIQEFAADYRVIVPDLRGHGRTRNPADVFTHRQAADDILALLDRLHVSNVRAMGVSTGGMTITHMATAQPSRFEAIVLIGSTSYFPDTAREIMREHHPDSLTQEKIESQAAIHFFGEDQIRKLHSCFLAFDTDYTDMNFTPPRLSTITARTLIIHGDRDNFFPVNIPLELYQSIPNSYLWIVPNGGHPAYGQIGEEFARISGEFLRNEWSGE